MNDMRLVQGQWFFTALELAEAAKKRGLKGFPGSERGVQLLAEREGWNNLPSRLTRQRPPAKAGGRPSMEYHFSVLPEFVQAVIHGLIRKEQLAREHADDQAIISRQIEALQMSTLRPHARKVMHARAEVLRSIEGYAIANGEYRSWGINRFLKAQKQFRARQEIEARRDSDATLTDQEIASLARPALLSAQDGFQLSPETLSTANDRKAESSISERTLFRWFKARDEHGVVSLAPTSTNEGKPVPAWFSDFLKFYARPSKPDASDAYSQYIASLPADVPHPKLSQVRYILRSKLNNVEKHVGREGLLTLRSRLPYVTRTTEDMWPTTIYSADGKTFDAEIADPITKRPIRPEITTVIDVVTRKIVGISLARSENQRSVAEALRNSCTSHGICAIFYVDRGPGYRNEAMDADVAGLMGRLGITKMHAAPYGSQAKGRIERPNATVWDVLAKRLPTFIGSDMDKEAGQKVHKLTRRELKEFGESRLLPAWVDFVRLCEDRVAEYNSTPHRSLPKFQDPETGRWRHMNPNECWQAHVESGFEPVPVDTGEADDLFRPYEIRTCRRGLVQWNGNQYFHETLEGYHETKIMVGYDYHQADKVWIREFDKQSGQPGKLVCVAGFMANAERYVPVSYERKAAETRAKGRLNRLERKIEAVEAERDAPYQLDHASLQPADFIDITPVETPESARVDPVAISDTPQTTSIPRRRVFASDEELAAWAIENPHEVSARQIEFLRKCMRSEIHREVMRMAGIDMEALRNLLRAAA